MKNSTIAIALAAAATNVAVTLLLMGQPAASGLGTATLFLAAGLSLAQLIAPFASPTAGFVVSPMEVSVFWTLASEPVLGRLVLLTASGMYLLALVTGLHIALFQFLSTPTLLCHKLSGLALLGGGRLGICAGVAGTWVGGRRGASLLALPLAAVAIAFAISVGGDAPVTSTSALPDIARVAAKATVFFGFSLFDTLCSAKSDSARAGHVMLNDAVLCKAVALFLAAGLGALPLANASVPKKPSRLFSGFNAALFATIAVVAPAAVIAVKEFPFTHVALLTAGASGLASNSASEFAALRRVSPAHAGLVGLFALTLLLFINPFAILPVFALSQIAIRAFTDNGAYPYLRRTADSATLTLAGFFETLYNHSHVARLSRCDARYLTLDLRLALEDDALFSENYRLLVEAIRRIPFKRITVLGLPEETKPAKSASPFSDNSAFAL